jgi:hypothetical protein
MHIDTLPEVCFTVLTGEGRFFSSGADLVANRFGAEKPSENAVERKREQIAVYAWYADLLRRLINVGLSERRGAKREFRSELASGGHECMRPTKASS